MKQKIFFKFFLRDFEREFSRKSVWVVQQVLYIANNKNT
jgi:hypothetical protein